MSGQIKERWALTRRWMITQNDNEAGAEVRTILVVDIFHGTADTAKTKLLVESTERLKPLKLWVLDSETAVESIAKIISPKDPE